MSETDSLGGLDEAIRQTEKSWSEGGIPIGGVPLDTEGGIVARGHNERVQSKRLPDLGMSLHFATGSDFDLDLAPATPGGSRTFPGGRSCNVRPVRASQCRDEARQSRRPKERRFREREAGRAVFRSDTARPTAALVPERGCAVSTPDHCEEQRKRRQKRRRVDHRDERSRERSDLKRWWSDCIQEDDTRTVLDIRTDLHAALWAVVPIALHEDEVEDPRQQEEET